MLEMNDIRIRYLIPLHDFITMVIFEDATKSVVDCKLLRNKHEELMPTLHPSLREGIGGLSEELGCRLAEEIGESEYRESPDDIWVTIEMEDELYRQTLDFCKKHELTMEKLFHAFCRFCTEENRSILTIWFSNIHLQEMREALAYAEDHAITRELFEQKIDEVLLSIDSGSSPILIRDNDGRELLLFGWTRYWELLGWVFHPGEKEQIEKEIAQTGNHELQQEEREEGTE